MSEPTPAIHVAAGMRRLLASEATSNFGSMLSRLAIPWIAALVLEATPLQMAWLVIADVVAGAAGSLFVGSLVDRTSKKNLMIVSDVLRAVAIGAVAVLLFMESLSFWTLVLQSAANGVLAMVFAVARSAWLAEHVPHGELTVRNSQMSAASSTSESVAFASGGWIYQWLGPMFALVSDAASYVISALCLRGLHELPQPSVQGKSARGNWMQEAIAGFSLVAARPVLRSLAVCDVFLALGFSITGASYMIFVSRDIAFETGLLGLIFATGALGSLAGAAIAPRLGRAMGSGSALAVGLAAAGLGALLIPMVPAAGLIGAALLIGHQIIGDSGSVVAMIHSRTLRQIHSPAAVRGRVDAALRGVSQFATLIGALAGGALATLYGTRVSLWLAAATILAAAPLVWGLFRASDLQEIASPRG
jgi:MFS family permease